jgi:hypothetical protein
LDAEQLAEWLQEHLPQISRLNLNPCHTRVNHVLNWGGFVNQSFSIEDGRVRYHLKITNDFDSARLKRWHTVSHVLKERYRAPEIIDWLEFPEIGFAGLLQQQIDGRTANLRSHPVLMEQLIDLLDRLHKDADVRAHFKASESAKTYLDHFIETYIDRFNADIELIVGAQLPFLTSVLLKWMRAETDRLQATADSIQAFHNRASEPVHGDLNENNVLVTQDSWFVLDWDDLAIGDPAIDFAVLAWPVVFEGGDWRELPMPYIDSDFQARIELCFRAQLLDEVIDPLADYVAAAMVPSKQAEVQLIKRQRHEEALERYRRTW